jgi:hypothetical protein
LLLRSKFAPIRSISSGLGVLSKTKRGEIAERPIKPSSGITRLLLKVISPGFASPTSITAPPAPIISPPLIVASPDILILNP